MDAGHASRDWLDFQAAQQTFQIGDVCIGGQPGVRATALIGSMFYHGQKVLIDEDRGEFQQHAAERLIREQEEHAQRTENPCVLDVVGSTPVALEKHLALAAEVTSMPLLIDGTTADVRLAGVRFAASAGFAERSVYNSIQPETSDEELWAIQDAGITSGILLTYYMKNFTAQGRIECARELLPRLQQAGIRHLLIDTCVLDLATLGSACQALHTLKNETGLPVGGGVHNAVAMWKGLKTKMGAHAYRPCVAAAAATAVAIGADFILYGHRTGRARGVCLSNSPAATRWLAHGFVAKLRVVESHISRRTCHAVQSPRVHSIVRRRRCIDGRSRSIACGSSE